ncbi:MAG: ABC transporter ATP-binding protein [Acidobacteria bacterium]|nr:ABC transporter ATP-binding protein [Acidobacteriota bacterium]
MANHSVLAVEHLSLQLGGARITADVTLAVEQGEMLGVIGPNGAGKTTLFNLISGVIRPTGGRILLDGKDITDVPVDARARAGIGRSFQTSNLFGGLSVFENVRLAAQASLGGSLSLVRAPRPGDRASRLAGDQLGELGLERHADTLAGSLSHGDKRKLEIAMMLAADPRVILLDEPMAGVGSGDVPELMEVIRRVHEQGRTVLMVEHHMDVVLGLVDRVAVMHHGQLLACDLPDVVMANPDVQSAYLGEPV